MVKHNKIEWTNYTANLWWRCMKETKGCDNCYALAFAKRVGNEVWGRDTPRRMIKDVWSKIGKFRKEAENHNEVHRIFAGSMMDIFDKPMPLVDHNGNPYPKEENEFWNTGQLSKVKGQRFLSIEPQLEKVDLMAKANYGTNRVLLDMVDWVIQGGKSGHKKQPLIPIGEDYLEMTVKRKVFLFSLNKSIKSKRFPNTYKFENFQILIII